MLFGLVPKTIHDDGSEENCTTTTEENLPANIVPPIDVRTTVFVDNFSKEIQAIDPTKLFSTMEEIEAKERSEHMIAQCKKLQPNSQNPTSSK